MYEATLSRLHGLLHKGKNGIHRVIFLIEDLTIRYAYILLSFCPVHRKVLNSEPFIEVGDCLRDSIDDVGHLVAYDELDVLTTIIGTFAASWSPMKRPSFIFIGPSRNSIVV
jgi:hypothetical protein